MYGWWFRDLPALIDTTECCMHDGLVLLYVGISPRRPPMTGEAASQQNIRQRLRTHYAGNAEGSTLRKTLGCLLAGQLGTQLRRVIWHDVLGISFSSAAYVVCVQLAGQRGDRLGDDLSYPPPSQTIHMVSTAQPEKARALLSDRLLAH